MISCEKLTRSYKNQTYSELTEKELLVGWLCDNCVWTRADSLVVRIVHTWSTQPK